MEDEATRLLLQGITFNEFKILFLVGIIGILARFLYNLNQGIKRDPGTPNQFKFRFFLKGFSRLALSLIILALVIARFQEFSYLLVNTEVEFAVPTRLPEGDEVEAIASITAGGAFMMGLFIDDIVKRVVSKGDKIVKKYK